MKWNPFKKSGETSIRTSKDLEDVLLLALHQTAAGINVTPDSALQCSAVFACCNVLASGVGQLPLKMYERKGSSREEVKSHDLIGLLDDGPNSYQSGMDFRSTMQFNFGRYENTYARVTRLGGRVLEIHPLEASRVTATRADDYSIRYKIKDETGAGFETVGSDEILHLKGITSNGWIGQSRVLLGRDPIATAIAAEKFGGSFFKNGAKAKGYFNVPAGVRLRDETFQRLKDQLNEAAKEPNSTPLLEDGVEFKAASQSAKDSQLTEVLQFQVIQIARYWHMQPHIIQSLQNATFSNIEHQGREFVSHTLMPWLKFWEEGLRKQLLSPAERKRFFFEFNVDAFLRGDSSARASLYQSGIQNAWLSPNEARAKENLPPRDGGDNFLQPLNMTTGNTENDQTAP